MRTVHLTLGAAMKPPMSSSVRVISICAVLISATAAGQVRNQMTLSSPGNFRTVGTSSAMQNFSSGSSSYGGFSNYAPAGPGGNLLQSSLSRRTTYRPGAIGNAASAMPAAPALGLPAAPSGHSFRTAAPGLTNPYAIEGGNRPRADQPISPIVVGDEAGLSLGGIEQQAPMYGLADAYLGLVGKEAGVLGGEQVRVTSLAPTGEAGLYGKYMTAGEQAMKQKDFYLATEQFELAKDLSRQSPEVLLSLAHARLAVARGSYRTPAYYLQQALRFLPELPLAQLELKALFPGPDDLHAEVLPRLTDHLAGAPKDGPAYLMLAYLLWFDGNPEAAQDALALAQQNIEEEDQLEGIDTFWDGMQASGKVQGELQPNQQLRQQGLIRPRSAPVAASQPAS